MASILVITAIIRIIVFDLYYVPSSSMEPTLVPGDYVLVNKLHYGARILDLENFFQNKKISFSRVIGLSDIERNDVFVFNYPDYGALNKKEKNFYGECLVKRCFAIPGDSIRFTKPIVYDIFEKPDTYDTYGTKIDVLTVTSHKYAPLVIPGKEYAIEFNIYNFSQYKEVLLYEGNSIKWRNDTVLINDQHASKFTFNQDYYFMHGDNINSSYDSRRWGFVPKNNIIGKVDRVIFSIAPNHHGIRKFRLKRLFKKVE